MDPLEILPQEIILKILKYLDVCSLNKMSQTSHDWHDAINGSDILWKALCFSQFPTKLIAVEKTPGMSWRDTFPHVYGVNKVRRKWLKGSYSRPSSFMDLPGKHFCPMDVDTWGEILEMELSRDFKPNRI